MATSYKHITKFSWLLIFASIFCYSIFAYDMHRSEFSKLLILYSFLFASFLGIVLQNKNNFKTLVVIGVVFRILLLFATPNLSDDFYRFIWDGRMIFEGLNPYLYLPENNTSLVAEGQKLYEGMGSMNGSHYTCYPPINQVSFLIPALLFSKNLLGSTVIIRLLLIAADLGTLYFGKKILEHFKLSVHRIFYFFLNPFIILELTGNLHFEGVMLFFLAAAFYYLLKDSWKFSAFLFSISVSIKLIPILFLPVLYKKLGLKKSLLFFSVVGAFNILFFLPFMSQELIDNFMSSIHLYFQNFEFNASIYYVIREIGYQIKGYNIIQSVGKITPILISISVILISLIRKNRLHEVLFESLLFSILIYYSFSSIVHPWYIAIPLFLSLFTRYKFPLIWSFCIILSYSAYTRNDYQENLFLVFVEYFIVYGYFMFELFFKKKSKQLQDNVVKLLT